ncbi:hypothetical protein Pla110_25160 [Polystyrenella longa]|uniref:Uncharacterized protein n=1 Tax=Polystyrenella longa TaxID=2528007 RepID=A0A518CNH2_9PLAN|nr:hypothetical protein [Polystyrenella longa]QDU80781.1 hypothetical protein Pla110_25160 [Polystyrenella longa]
MNILKMSLSLLVVTSLSAGLARADWVELTNLDVISGSVVDLNKTEVLIHSDNFGEMKIPREKVSLIGLGDRPQPSAVPSVSQALPESVQPNGGNAEVDRLYNEVLRGGDIQNMRKNIEQSREGLKDLQKDLDEPSAQALDSYIKMLDFFGTIAPDAQPESSKPTPKNTPNE